MLAILVLLGLVAALFAPTLRPGSREKSIDAIVSELQSILLVARTNAIARGTTETVWLSIAGREIAYGQRRLAIAQHLTTKLLVGRELLAADGEAKLLFFADGGSSGAEIVLTDRRQNTMVVVVPWLTGVATLSESHR